MTRYMSRDRFLAIYRRLGAPLKDTDPAEAHELWETIYSGENSDNEIMQFGRETAPTTRYEGLSDHAREESIYVLLLTTAFDRWDPPLGKVRRFPVRLPKGVKATKLPAKGQPPNLLDLPRFIKLNEDKSYDPAIEERQRASYASPWNLRSSGYQSNEKGDTVILCLLLVKEAKLAFGLSSFTFGGATDALHHHRMRSLWGQSVP
ncbi:hypothetical protein SEPCBS57363_003679 [Sporothrix epigloea]|uniref:Uncharacterized protein n=1 Tax=Sporothrix epigloea TaxID=1892477 RepID=A0ABP0DMS5_9PEZI